MVYAAYILYIVYISKGLRPLPPAPNLLQQWLLGNGIPTKTRNGKRVSIATHVGDLRTRVRTCVYESADMSMHVFVWQLYAKQ